MDDLFTPHEAALVANLAPRRLAYLAKHPAVRLACDGSRKRHHARTYTLADVYAVALLSAALNAGFTKRQGITAIAATLRMIRELPATGAADIAALLIGVKLDVCAADETRLGQIDLGRIAKGIEIRIPKARNFRLETK